MLGGGPVIIAIASAPGHSARGILRASGEHVFDLFQPLLDSPLPPTHAGEIRSARLALAEGVSMPVLQLAFIGPRSYTGENSIELQLPGNPMLLNRVMDRIIASAAARSFDCRVAHGGEFTSRAFLSGRLSLTQAEGVAATIAAQSDAELRAAHLLRNGALHRFAAEQMETLAGALALVEAGIDFTDQEDVVAIAPDDLLARLRSVRSALHNMLSRCVAMEQLEAIPWVVLVGEPNAGKSTLFNALLDRPRAVVSAESGTTRDVITEPLHLQTEHGDAEIMLVDLAGIDADAHWLNQRMQAAARAAIDRAELLVQCVSADIQTFDAISDAVVVRTKCDVGVAKPQAAGAGALWVAAVTGDGMCELKAALARRLSDRAVSLAADAAALQPRQEAELSQALGAVDEAIPLVESQRHERALEHQELIAASMRTALDHLGSLAGRMTPDDVLGRIFATFCVGK